MRAALLLLCLSLCRAEVVDRVVVSIGNQAITEFELLRELRVRAFLDRRPADYSAKSKRLSADRLVEQKLVARETELSPYPVDTEGETTLEDLRQEYGSPAGLLAALKQLDLTEADVTEYLEHQKRFLSFIDWRFRSGVQVSDEDIADYFTRVVKPLAQAANPGKTVNPDDYHEQIETTLIGQRIDREVEQWLKEARQRTRVEYREELLK